MKSFIKPTFEKKAKLSSVIGKALLATTLITAVPATVIVSESLINSTSAQAASYTTTGPIGVKYAQLGGESGGLGKPIANQISAKDDGFYQNFEKGSIFWSSATGAKYTFGAIRGFYASAGAMNGSLGYPVTDEVGGLRNGGVYQNFQKGAILWSPTTGTHISVGAIRDKWASTGFENGRMGYPTTDEVGGLKDGGIYQNYQGGAILWSPNTGAHLSFGGIRTVWASIGFENGALGYPTTDEYSIPGGVAQDYQGGYITATAAGGIQIVKGDIFQKHEQMGRSLGFVVSPQIGIKNGGLYQNFQNGSILWSPASGAHPSFGGTRSIWASTGFENGFLGYPISDEIGLNGGVYQNYQGGSIYWSHTLGGRAVTADFNNKLVGSGGINSFGFPVSDKVTGIKNNGAYQNFQNGALIYSPQTGVKASIGKTRNAWASTGFENGKLGYPTSDNYVTADGSTVQDFQGGKITISPNGASKIDYNGSIVDPKVAEEAYKTQVYNTVKNWCPDARITLNDPKVVSGDVYGWAWWDTPTFSIRYVEGMPPAITKSIALHECGHLLQAKAFGTAAGAKEQAKARFQQIYGGTGEQAIEANADCISYYLGPKATPTDVWYQTPVTDWNNRCTGAKGDAAIKIINGQRP